MYHHQGNTFFGELMDQANYNVIYQGRTLEGFSKNNEISKSNVKRNKSMINLNYLP